MDLDSETNSTVSQSSLSERDLIHHHDHDEESATAVARRGGGGEGDSGSISSRRGSFDEAVRAAALALASNAASESGGAPLSPSTQAISFFGDGSQHRPSIHAETSSHALSTETTPRKPDFHIHIPASSSSSVPPSATASPKPVFLHALPHTPTPFGVNSRPKVTSDDEDIAEDYGRDGQLTMIPSVTEANAIIAAAAHSHHHHSPPTETALKMLDSSSTVTGPGSAKASAATITPLDSGAGTTGLAGDARKDSVVAAALSSTAPARKSRKVGSYSKASYFSKLTFQWFDSILRRARSRKLKESDLGIADSEEAQHSFELFNQYWQTELAQSGWTPSQSSTNAAGSSDQHPNPAANGAAAAAAQERPQPSLFRALSKAFWRDFFIAAIYKLIWGGLVILAASYFVIELVQYVRDKTGNDERGWILSAFYFVVCFVLSASLQQMTSLSSRVGIRVRGAMMTAVYRKAMALEGISSQVGNVVTLVSNDCSRLNDGCTNFHYLWSGPLEAIIIVAVIFSQTGASATVGFIIALLIVPLQYLIALAVANVRRQNIAATDVRVQVMHEILQAIKLVKFYAWERSFANKVENLRSKELQFLNKSAVFKTIHLVVVFWIPVLLVITIFSVYIFWQGEILKATVTFAVLSLFNTLRFPLVVLPVAMKNFSDTISALQRISHFLLLPEMLPLPKADSVGIFVNNATFSYTKEKDDAKKQPLPKDSAAASGKSPLAEKEKTNQPVSSGTKELVHGLQGANVNISKPAILAVVGSVGSGKTSLINGIIGDAIISKGSVSVGGKLAYVPQTSWIQHATVRDNILFGKPMDEERYRRAIFACALERDLEILQYGDMTEIGESGINLSGGQKQRISLARAVYADADVYLLDSPLSAVDHHTCNHIFEHCIKGLLAKKVIVLVTHQLHLLPQCDLVLICKDSEAVYCGPFDAKVVREAFAAIASEVPDSAPNFVPVWRTHPVKPLSSLPMSPESVLSTVYPASLEEEVLPEGKEGGKKSRKNDRSGPWYRNYIEWFRQGTRIGFFFSLLIFAGTQVIRILSDLYVREWTDNAKDPDQKHYLGVYGGYCAAFFVALFLRGYVFFLVTLRASTRLHNKMFRAVLRAPLAFFTVTPMGPLLNCFSRLQDQVDETLPDALHMSTIYLMILITTVAVIILVIPYFALVTAVLIVTFILLQLMYGRGAKFLKTLVSVSTPAVYAHVSETLHGISVVRAYEAQGRFSLQNIKLINRNHVALFNMEQLQCWIAFRLDTVASVMVLATALFCVAFRTDTTPSNAGLAISNALQMLVFLTKLVRGLTDVRGQITAVESIVHYIRNTTSEPSDGSLASVTSPRVSADDADQGSSTAPTASSSIANGDEVPMVAIHGKTAAAGLTGSRLPARKAWPSHGRVEFSGVKMRYFPTSDLVLRGVSFDIKPKEKIGIVGRTGSGKSTLLMALFRLVEPEDGKVYIDGTDCSQLSLEYLRSSLAIIPQEPVMFQGTIRSNLDPFNEHSDEELLHALELSHLKEVVESMPLRMDTPVAADGADLSLGQKQLFCLTRAILKNSAILVLDEATSALDLETDALIQKTIRDVFFDRTVMTIAHRLETILDYDKVLFLDNGTVLEFGPIEQLKNDPASHFYKLVHAH